MVLDGAPRVRGAWRPVLPYAAALLLWDVVVTVVWFARDGRGVRIELQFSLFGSAIALFIGFAVNAAYARWWEARTLWGAVINGSRSLARQALTLLDEQVPTARPSVVPGIVHAQIAFAHALRASLRGADLPQEAEEHLPVLRRASLRSVRNQPNAVLTDIGRLAQEAARAGMVDPIARVRLESTLMVLSDAQGGLERIKNTPLPVQYRLLPALFARVFCVVLPVAVVPDLGLLTPVGSTLVGVMFLMAVQVGKDLADPFTGDVNDVPMTALTSTIETDLLQMLSRRAPALPHGAEPTVG